MSEESTKQIKSRDLDKLEIPDNCFCFYFFDRQEITCQNELHKTETLKGEPKNISNRYYPDGKIYTQKKVEKLNLRGNLLSNMKSNGWKKVVKCDELGNFFYTHLAPIVFFTKEEEAKRFIEEFELKESFCEKVIAFESLEDYENNKIKIKTEALKWSEKKNTKN